MFTTGKFKIIQITFLKQFYCGYGYVPTANEKGMYTKLWTEDDSKGASNYLGKGFSVSESINVTWRIYKPK